MSRLPPHIKQQIDGQPVAGWHIQPISSNGVTYTISSDRVSDADGHITGMDWKLQATDPGAAVLWDIVYYHQEFDRRLETDVQERFPIDLRMQGDTIVIEHEQGSLFHIAQEGTLLNDQSVAAV